MPSGSSSRLILAAAVAGLWAAPCAAQESDFFEQASDYFKGETIEGVSKHAEAPTETPATVTVIGREEIERYGFRTLSDVLNFASLGNVSQWDRRYDLAGSRGMYFFEDFNTRILVMLNGHSLNEPWANFADVGRAMLVPLDLVERIEIVYGPSSLLYGGYSLYGIVNVVTRTGGSMPGARVRLAAGSSHTGEAVASWGASGTTGGEDAPLDWSVLAAAGYYSTRGESLDLPQVLVDYDVDYQGGRIWGGPQTGTDFERAPFAFVHARRGEVSFMARGGYRRRGSPFAPYGAVYGTAVQSIRDQKIFAELRWDHALTPRLTLSGRLFHDVYDYDERDPYADSVSYPGESRYDFVLATDDHDTGAEARFNYRRGTHFLTFGGEYRYRSLGQSSRNEFADGRAAPDSTIRVHSTGRFGVVYAQDEWRPADRLSLVLGGNWAQTDPGGGKAQPRVAVIFKPRSTLSIKGLYGRGFRPPSIFEASYVDNLNQIDNPDLRSEAISSSELSVIWNASRRFAVQGYGFRSRLKGLIRGVTIESPADIQGGVVGPTGNPADLVGLLQYQSRGHVRSSGAGVGLRFRGGLVRGFFNVSYAKARLEPRSGDEERLPGASGWLASSGVSVEKGGWTGSLVARYLGPQPLDPSRGEGEAGDFVEANLGLSYRTRILYPVTLRLDVRNLFDGKGTIAASTVYAPATLPIEGRRILLAGEVGF